MKRFSILPLACYAIMLAYAGYGALVVGHWPYYAHPDPKELPLEFLLGAVAIVMLVGVAALLLIPIGYVAWRVAVAMRHQQIDARRKAVIVYSAGALLWVLDFAALHGDMPWHSTLNWLLD